LFKNNERLHSIGRRFDPYRRSHLNQHLSGIRGVFFYLSARHRARQMRVKQRTLPLSDSWFVSLHQPRARTPAHRCKHV